MVPRRRLVLAAALMAIFMPAVESSIVATALPTIIGDLGGFHLFSWVFAVPLLTQAVTIPLYGRLADLYGRKRVFFAGTLIFLVGTTLCGFARSMVLLIVFRALQGVGAGAIQPIAATIIGDIYTPAERARVQGASSAVWGFAAVVGPAITLPGVAIAGLLALGAGALAWLAIHERRVDEPILPLALWRRRVLALSNLGALGGSATYMAISALLPTYVQGAMGYSPRISGFVVGAASVSWMFASIVAGRLMIRTSYRLTAAIGGACLVGGSAILVSLDPAGNVWWPATGSLLMGIGMGFCNTTFLVSIQGTVAWNERGVATGSQMFMRMMGMSIGSALLGAIINFGVHRRLPGGDEGVNELLHAGARQHLGSAEIAHLANAVASSAHDAFLVGLLIAAATLALTLAFPRRLNPTRLR